MAISEPAGSHTKSSSWSVSLTKNNEGGKAGNRGGGVVEEKTGQEGEDSSQKIIAGSCRNSRKVK